LSSANGVAIDWTGWNHGAEGEASDPKVQIQLTVTDETGTPIDSIGIGETALLNVAARDIRPATDLSGVFAAYTDLRYDADFVTPRISSSFPFGFDLRFSADYPNGKSGNARTLGLLDEVGAFQAGYTPLGPDPRTVVRIPFDARSITPVDDVLTGIMEDSPETVLDVLANDRIQTGTARFSGRPADIRPEHATLLFSPPEFIPDSAIEFIDAQLHISAAGHDVITSTGQPDAGGSVRISADGNQLLYTPAKDFHGDETFTYTVVSGEVARVTVRVEPTNDVPTAVPDAYVVQRNQTLDVFAATGLLANDSDIDGDPLSVSQYTQPAHGVLVLESDGSFRYAPPVDYRGADTFTYVITDGQSESQPAAVTLDVGPPKIGIRLEVVDGDGHGGGEWTEGSNLWLRAWVRDMRDASYPARGVAAAYLDIAFDPEVVGPIQDASWPLGFQALFGSGFQDPGSGNATLAGLIDEIGSYRPMGDPTGPGSQLLLEMPFATTGPHAADDDFQVNYQSRLNALDLLANDRLLTWPVAFAARSADKTPDSDVRLVQPPGPVSPEDIQYTGMELSLHNRQDLIITAVSDPDHGGSVSISADGQHVNYAPARGFEGAETFAYTFTDGKGNTATAQVTLHIVPSWHNLRSPLDVNDDGHISPIDALIVINDLNQNHSRLLDEPPTGAPFLDVDDDHYVRPLDALLVINGLNQHGEGEAEANDLAPRPGSLVHRVPHAVWADTWSTRRGRPSIDANRGAAFAVTVLDNSSQISSGWSFWLFAMPVPLFTRRVNWLDLRHLASPRDGLDLLQQVAELLAASRVWVA